MKCQFCQMRCDQVLLLLSSLISSYRAQTCGDVRLVNRLKTVAPGDAIGIPEVYLDGKWGTVTFNTSSPDSDGTSQTVCRQLGFDDGMPYPSSIRPVDDSVPVLLTILACPFYIDNPNRARSHILRCSYVVMPADYPNYSHKSDLAVRCQNWPTKRWYDTQVRLVQGGTDYTSSGFVEVYLHDSWGPVCDLGQYDADTVCRQLGYTNAVGRGSSDSYRVSSSGKVTDKLDHFTCNTSFECLHNCFTYPSTSDDITCIEHSWVNCTFNKTSSNSAGGYDACFSSTTNETTLAPSPPKNETTLAPAPPNNETTGTTANPASPTDDRLEGILIAVGVVVLGLLIAIAVTLLCCCCIPGCALHGLKRHGSYERLVNDDLPEDYHENHRLYFDEMH